MKKIIVLSILLPIILCAQQITTQVKHDILGVVESENVSSRLNSPTSRTVLKTCIDSMDVIYDADSLHTVLLPNEAVFFEIDLSARTVTKMDLRDSLPSACIDAIELSPLWLRDDLEQSFRNLPADTAEMTANAILSAPENEIDEVAFCVANMSPEGLCDERFDADLLLINSNFIYRVADSLSYVELMEYGDIESGDWFTTTAYWVVDSTLTDTVLMEVPREIYYWYVVHPKLSDESPKRIDIASDTEERTYGYFWREYLWTDPNPVFRYSAGGYPMLPDWIKMAQVLWIRNDTVLAADRWITPECGALDILGEWVSTVMPDPPSSLRPVQPNQIAYIHKGNCGEVQDLLGAACRTALIPDLLVGTFLQDHVWNEFWDNVFPGEYWTEDDWHCYQVDRWGGVTSLAPYWGGYDRQRGGSKKVNNCLGFRGDGYCPDRTPAYTAVCTLIVEANDENGNPIPGAEVMITSNALWDPTTPYYTADVRAADCNGRIVVAMGDSCPFYYRVDTPIGCEPGPGFVTSFPDLGSGYSEIGAIYTASVTISASLPELQVTVLEEDMHPTRLHVSFASDYEYIRGSASHNRLDGIKYSYRSENGIVSALVCDSHNFALYRDGEPFEAYEYHSRVSSGEFVLKFDGTGMWYVVLSTEETVTNDNVVSAIATLGYASTDIAGGKLPSKPALSISPNPFNAACEIKVSGAFTNGVIDITDICGKRLMRKPVEPSENIIWNPKDEVSGIYFVRLVADSEVFCSKLLLVR